ncbi:methyl-accepting chemotaxis protein [Pseudoalteromonas ulvae UL12]|uniref:Chemotaxis protein n=1 Tax=Pseudoalteromonas ulvae TaxID=107327 RepID=A0A244CRG2_PSEDV|nr:methyl-accepting chemotaxis protein [Pseudoalteromonas ulvae]MBE0366094.1 methyl-accepting chemotaxis protein [Pseudoalteromonas ulvae UL12]OUL58184.1 chemotaxis protein [Pseudoalteromonas ulvae]
MNLKVSQSLYLGFGSIVAITLILALIVWSIVTESAKIAQEIAKDDVPGVLAYLNVSDKISTIQTNALEYLNGEEDEKISFAQNKQAFTQAFAELVPLESSKQSDRDKMAKIESLANSYIKQLDSEVFIKYSPLREQTAIKRIRDLTKNVGLPLENLLDQLKEEEFNDAYKTTDLQESLNDDLPGVRYYLELVDEAGDMISSLNAYIAGDPDAKIAFKNDSESFQSYLTLIKPLEQKPNELVNIQKIEDYYSEIKVTAQEVFGKYDPKHKAAAIALIDTLEHELVTPLQKILQDSAKEEEVDATSALTSLNNNVDNVILWLLINAAVVLAVGSTIAWKISSMIKFRLDVISAKAKSIANGDLTSELINDSRTDELGGLSRSIDEMQRSLKDLIKQISNVANQVATSTAQVEESSSQVVQGSQSQADKAHLIAAAVEQMSITVKEVAAQSADAANTSQKAGEEAQEGGRLMQETVNGINRIAEVVNETASTVDSLGRRGEEIGDVIKVINDIAEQTNLLALNAAIEAARAGELGRGFAVVADEVRGLAERTSKATKEVGTLISSIQNETRQAVSRMGDGTELVAAGVQLANEAGEALSKIVQRTIDANTMIHAIATASDEQSYATQEISRDITAISDIANDSVAQTKIGSSSAKELDEKVSELEQLVARFKVN